MFKKKISEIINQLYMKAKFFIPKHLEYITKKIIMVTTYLTY